MDRIIGSRRLGGLCAGGHGIHAPRAARRASTSTDSCRWGRVGFGGSATPSRIGNSLAGAIDGSPRPEQKAVEHDAGLGLAWTMCHLALEFTLCTPFGGQAS